MSVIQGNAFSDDAVDTGDIGHSLRFRRSASASITTSTNPATTSTYFCLFKQGALGAINPIFDGNIKINANNTITAFGLTTTAVARDPTSFHWMHISNNGLVFDGVNLGAVTTSAITGLRLGYDGTNYADMYGARMCVVSGTSLPYTDFVTFNTTINEWVVKSKSAIKALVDAGDAESSMYEFDDATSLTTLGYDESSKANNATLNNFSLTAGPTYDHMLDVPGNSYCTINPIAGSTTGTASDGNLKLTTGTTHCRWFGTMAMSAGSWVWEGTCTNSIANDIIGIIRTDQSPNGGDLGDAAFGYGYRHNGDKKNNATSSAYGASYTSGDAIRMEYNATSGSLTFFKNGTTQGVAYSGLTGEYYPAFGDTVNASGGTVWNLNFGQAPLHASATYHSAAGGYFRDVPTTGFKALCQANMPDVAAAVLSPKNGFVAVTATEDNIDSTLASARSGWSDFVDVKKNLAAVESWAWQFSHDSTNEYAVSASSLVRQAKRAMSGSNTWEGFSIRIGASYGTAAGSVSHTNGVATTITHNIGVSARQMILIFNRAGGTAVPMYHPDLTSGELLDLCTTAADAASTAITSVLTNSFQIGSGVATGTYDYLVCSELSGLFDLGKWTGNASADGAYYDAGHKPSVLYAKALSTTDEHRVYNTLRPGYNVIGGVVLANTTAAETTAAEMDFTSRGMKARITTTPNAAQTYVTASWASVAGKYSLAR